MHGTADSQIPVENVELLKSAGGDNVQLDLVKGTDQVVVQGAHGVCIGCCMMG